MTDRVEGAGPRVGRLAVVPMDLDSANDFVRIHHRHHRPVVGHKFSLGAMHGETLVGVSIIGRPVARRLDNGWTLEVNRLCTDGTRNACSFLYGASWRATRALGYRRLITYTLPEEGGASLRAAGWRLVGETPGRSWSVPSRPRLDKHPLQERLIWEAAHA
jgi:hypothetical protein